MMQSCKTCRHLDVQLDAAGRRVVRRLNSYRCTVPDPDLSPLLPECITRAYGFQAKMSRSHMSGESGAECPLWEPLA